MAYHKGMSFVWGGFAFALCIPNIKLAVPSSKGRLHLKLAVPSRAHLTLPVPSRNNLKLAVGSHKKKRSKDLFFFHRFKELS